jgi:hypothetical protein
MDTLTDSAEAFLTRVAAPLAGILVLTLVLMIYIYLSPSATEFFASGPAPPRKEGSAAAVVA